MDFCDFNPVSLENIHSKSSQFDNKIIGKCSECDKSKELYVNYNYMCHECTYKDIQGACNQSDDEINEYAEWYMENYGNPYKK